MRPKERLRLRRSPTPIKTDDMRKALEAWSDRLSRWEDVSTAVVVLGLAVEYLPQIGSAIEWAFAVAFPSIKTHTGLLNQLGGFLVIAGVAGELLVSIRASRVETDLREEINEVIARAEERAAQALRAAAEANLARAQIEQRMNPRVLDETEFKGLAEMLVPYKTTQIEIIVFDVHVGEPLIFSDQLASLFVSAGFASVRHWEAEAGTHRLAGPSVIIAVAKGHEEEFGELANTLARSLRALGIECGVGLGVFGCEGRNSHGVIAPFEFGPPQYRLRSEKPMRFMGIRATRAIRVEVGAKQLATITTVRPPMAPQA